MEKFKIENLDTSLSEGSWGWVLGAGVVTCLFGILAYISVFATTLASMLVLGVLVMGAAVMQIAAIFSNHKWKSVTLHVLLALLYAFAGVIFITQPMLAADSMTLFLGVFLIMSGVFRIVGSFTTISTSRTWAFCSGAISAALGGVILASWPVTSLFTIGLFIGIDLMFLGLYLIMFAFAIRRYVPHIEHNEALYN